MSEAHKTSSLPQGDPHAQTVERIREVYPDGRNPCAWCGVRPPKHNFDCPVPDVHFLLNALGAACLRTSGQQTNDENDHGAALLRVDPSAAVSTETLTIVWLAMTDAERFAEYQRIRRQRDARWPETLTREQRAALGHIARLAKADWLEVSTADDPLDEYEAMADAVAISLPSVIGSGTPSLSEASGPNAQERSEIRSV